MNKREIIIDANPMIAALLRGKALDIIFSRHFLFYTTERKIWEVKRYIPMIAAKTLTSEENVLDAFERFPVTAYQDAFFEEQKARALELIGKRDPTDADLLALTLKLGYPLWSNDHDFKNIPGILVFSTEILLAEIARIVS